MTYQEVSRSFPYLVAKEFASGGGDVSAIRMVISKLEARLNDPMIGSRIQVALD